MTKINLKGLGLWILIVGLLFVSCSSPAPEPTATIEPTVTAEPSVERPEWFGLEITDVNSDEIFTMNDFAGKVVLLETMATWCPNCIRQGLEVTKLHEMLGEDSDLISVSLDVDLNEDAAMLKQYTDEFGFDWHFAVSPLLVSRALGNLYTAQYLNPPLSPMLIIDRQGNVHHLEYGHKDAEKLLEAVEPYLNE